MSDRLRKPVNAALQELHGTVHALDELIDRLEAGHEPTNIELYALAYMLETFYTWVENVLKCIARALDEPLPSGMAWHKKLLRQMACPGKERPAVLSESLHHDLSRLRSFRHRSRNLSLEFVAWNLVKPLALAAPDTLAQFDEAITHFLDQMDAK